MVARTKRKTLYQQRSQSTLFYKPRKNKIKIGPSFRWGED